ncbi:methyltransferase small domain protein [Prevotella disiens JCM 6334 = ATCC 29426]|uniref:tRNA1(Val) (adenine(37)-N6)-methyltransferase n=2 Tax=Prevotella disiens TaxID=28130 RepID=A0A379DYD7_9BACT|nr:methyltransferase [Prevotella disiens]ERJ81242.1 methyltransferase small domain protein [Prevotella disiens JCM 6334 = ATCC 29426]SUB85359.1 tRNA1(Val) (adenine(37)-N6)-methyltransferase [Prevotella disiens]
MGFTFKQFHIEQDQCAMKVGTDGVLLGSWANGGEHILDIGTGTGLLALMMAQRFEKSLIDAIEIEENAYQQAVQNVAKSVFKSKINIIHSSLQNFAKSNINQYDSIICNPPYFVNSLKNNKKSKTIARHNDTLPFNELISLAYKLLKTEGTLSLVLPVNIFPLIETEAVIYGFFLNRKISIKTTEKKQPKRVLVEYKKEPTQIETSTEYLLNQNGEKSIWYQQLTNIFYIN